MNSTDPNVALPSLANELQLRQPRWLFLILLFIFGGPLNFAVWWLGHQQDESWSEIYKFQSFYFFLLMPSSLMALISAALLARRDTFYLKDIIVAVAIGLLTTVLLWPLIFLLGGAVVSEQADLVDATYTTIFAYFMGWLFAIIPYYAIAHGIPCAFVLFLVLTVLVKKVKV